MWWILLVLIPFTTMDKPAGKTGDMIVDISNIRVGEGCLRLGIYDTPEAFVDKNAGGPYGKMIRSLKKTRQTVVIPDLPYGRYVLALYQDCNDNGKLDTNFFGVPTEPYAFSNNPGNKWSSPSFADAAITFSPTTPRISLALRTWKER